MLNVNSESNSLLKHLRIWKEKKINKQAKMNK